MNVALSPELEKFVGKKVKSGDYKSASEVISDGLRLLEDEERLRRSRFEDVRRKIQTGLDQLDRGEGIPAEEVRQQIKNKSRALRRARR
jgi:antitoxin ParD1/3/4